MRIGTLDDQYFEWLYKVIRVNRNRNPEQTYIKLAHQLYKTPFYWYVSNDDNRAEDGKCLRDEFMNTMGIDEVPTDWYELDCSVLEMLIALAGRVSFESHGTPGDWFWKFMNNLELNQYNDLVYCDSVEREISHSIGRFLEREYERNGEGGLFPLQHPKRDQRKVELWYQMSAYLLEGGYVDHGP